MQKQLICVALLGALSASAFGQLSGRQVIDRQKALHEPRTEYAEQTLLLVDKKGHQEKRQLRFYSKKTSEGVYHSLLAFLEPAGIRGTALLTWQHADRDDDQWLYLPAMGKMQRIAGGSKKNYFVGTDFTYEDLQTEEVDHFTYTVLREEALDKTPVYVIEAVPADQEQARDSGYSRRVMWIDKERFTTLKIEFYDRRERLVKTQTNRDWVQVGGTRWRAEKSLMENHTTGHKTLIGVSVQKVDAPIDDQTFTERFILQGQHVR